MSADRRQERRALLDQDRGAADGDAGRTGRGDAGGSVAQAREALREHDAESMARFEGSDHQHGGRQRHERTWSEEPDMNSKQINKAFDLALRRVQAKVAKGLTDPEGNRRGDAR